MSKIMCSMSRVFDAMNETRQQHDDGLLHRGEAVQMMMGKLQELAVWDLREARMTVEAYNLDGKFDAYCEDDRTAEEKAFKARHKQ